MAGNLTGPVFNAGRTTSQVELAKAQKDEAAIRYQQAALQAFREVNDALFAYQKTREGREVETRLVASARQAFGIAEKRYAHGLANYLDVLDAQRELFNAELALTRTQREQLSSLVQLYRALGGGWTTDGDAAQTAVKTSSALLRDRRALPGVGGGRGAAGSWRTSSANCSLEANRAVEKKGPGMAATSIAYRVTRIEHPLRDAGSPGPLQSAAFCSAFSSAVINSAVAGLRPRSDPLLGEADLRSVVP